MRYLVAALLWGLSAFGAYAQNLPALTEFMACVTTTDNSFATLGFGRVRCNADGSLAGVGGGGGSGGGNVATTSNATDGQATSTTNQQNVTFNYLFNGTTWDRMRGTGGAANVIVSNFPASQAVTNAGTFAVQNTAAVVGGNTTAVKTDGSATTQPISAASLPLPTGASTATNQANEIAQLTTANARALYVADWAGQAAAASATITGTSRDAGASPSSYSWVSFVGTASVSGGTFFLQASNDNFSTSFATVATVAVTTASPSPSSAAAIPVSIADRVRYRYYRAVYANGTTAGTITGSLSLTAN